MNIGDIITIILGSSVLSTVLTILYNTWRDRHTVDQERQNKLYAQLHFYLRLLAVTKSVREELIEDIKKSFELHIKHFEGKDQPLKEKLHLKMLEDIVSVTTPLIKDSWSYIEKIKQLLEESAKYIRPRDWDIVEQFFKEYLVREIVVGKDIYEDTSDKFSTDKIIDAFDAVFKIVDQMRIRIAAGK
jgi:hypothetical protein